MKGDPEKLIHELSRRYFWVLALVAALLLVDQAVFQPLLIQLNGYGPVINLAGRQRMLSQRMTKAALTIAHESGQTDQRFDELQESLDAWLQVHDGLQYGNKQLQLSGTEVKRITKAFRDIDPHVHQITTSVRKVLTEGVASKADIDEILLHEQSFLIGMDEIVSMFEEEAARQVTRMRWMGLAATLLVLALMIGIAKLVIQPASEFIRTQVHQLADSEERFRLLVERMNDGLAVFDFDGRLTYVNRRFSEMVRIESEQLVGTPLQKLLSGSDLRLFLQWISQVLPSPEIARELCWKLPDGKTCLTLAAFGTTHVQEENNSGLSFLVVTDISELKQAEAKIREARDALEIRVTERTQELTEANQALSMEVFERKEAQERNRLLQSELAHATRVTTLGQFATGLAHEINQPLGAIANYAETLNLHLNTENCSSDNLFQLSTKIQDSALRAGKIVRRMRNFLKTKPSQKTNEPINELIEEVLDLCSPEIRIHHIQVESDLLCSQSLYVLVDAIHIQQVLVNLINNAIQAMGNISQPRKLMIRTEERDDRVVVFVEDNGPGFPPENLIGEIKPFRSTKSDGLGMGLSISHALLTAHGGEFWFENSALGGARIGFSLTTIRNSDSYVQSDHICRR